MKITLLDNVNLMKCMGANDADASEGVLYRNSREMLSDVSQDQRVLIIGLGGQGVKTVNQIKNLTISKLRDWQGKIAFAVLDTDNPYMKQYTTLDDSEKFWIPASAGINQRYNQAAYRSEFTNSWINPKFFTNLMLDGANQIRQACKAKMFDSATQSFHMDDQIVQFLKNRSESVLNGFNNNRDTFRIHIVTGIAGGTGSGGLIELTHFVHRAFDHLGRIQVCGYLYLPDVVEEYHIGKASLSQIRSNGYAALKELDYYYSVFQRHELYKDYLYMSTEGAQHYTIDRFHKLYDMVYLVSGDNGNAVINKNKNAVDTISESIINQLTDTQNANGEAAGDNQYLTSSFIANKQAGRDQKLGMIYRALDGREESEGQCGEDCFDYNAIGVASASIPEQTIKMYAAARIMRTISGETNGFTPTGAFHAFRKEPLTEIEAQAQIRELLQITPESLSGKIREFCQKQLKMPTERYKSKEIIMGGIKEQFKNRMGVQTAEASLTKAVNEYLDKQLLNFKATLRTFLSEYGPAAYVAMYRGVDSAGRHYENNLSAKISSCESINTEKMKKMPKGINPDKYSNDVADIEKKLENPIVTFFTSAVEQWHAAFYKQQIELETEKIAEHVFGDAGVYRSRYLDKIREISESVIVFDYTLKNLVDTYESMGTKFDSRDKFVAAAAEENAVNVNIIETESNYRWAKEQVDKVAESIAFSDIKEKIVKSFIDNPAAWTEYDSDKPSATPRREMDRILSDYVNFDDQLSVIKFINHEIETGKTHQQFVQNLVSKLLIKATPLYHVKAMYLPDVQAVSNSYLIIPQVLINAGEQGTQLYNAFQTECAEKNVTIYPSGISDKIVCYSIYNALPFYTLNDLGVWESAYEGAPDFMLHSNESNKGIYNKETGLTWRDYPALLLKQNPRLPSPHDGSISKEGKFYLNELDPLFETALNLGVIKENVTNKDGETLYSYSCYLMNKPGWDYTVSFTDYTEKDKDGLYLTGESLFRYFERKNHRNGDLEYQEIALLLQGKFNDPHPDRRIAIDRAKRALRRNVPQFIAIKNTVQKYLKVTEEIRSENAKALKIIVSKVVPYYIADGTLVQLPNKSWIMKDYPSIKQQIEICRTDAISMDGNAFFENNLLYLIIREEFMNKMLEDQNVRSRYKESFKEMIDDPESYKQEFIDRLNPFYEEALAFVDKYDGQVEGSGANRRNLCAALEITSGELDDYIKHYKRVVEVFNQIKKG